jgi:hypothetical protein
MTTIVPISGHSSCMLLGLECAVEQSHHRPAYVQPEEPAGMRSRPMSDPTLSGRNRVSGPEFGPVVPELDIGAMVEADATSKWTVLSLRCPPSYGNSRLPDVTTSSPSRLEKNYTPRGLREGCPGPWPDIDISK